MEIIFNNVSKKFDNNLVINKINFTVNTDEIYCLLGSNGSGKSTIINLISNLLEPNEGEIKITNIKKKLNPIEFKKIIGFQSQYDNLIEELNAYDFLEFIRLIYKIEKKTFEEQKKKLINYFFENGENLSNRIETYSMGMKKKLQLCAAFIHSPKIILLDEPFTNLDPNTSLKLCSLLKSYTNKNRIIFICSHNLQYVERIATNIFIIKDTKMVYNNDLNNLTDFSKLSLEDAYINFSS